MKETFDLQGLYRVQKKDLKKCAEVAARAFIDDPSSKYLLKKKLSCPKLYNYYLNAFKALYSDAYILAPSEAVEGVLILMPPGASRVASGKFIKAGGLLLPFSVCWGILSRSIEYENNNCKIRQSVCPDETWYIFQVAVDPEKQGLGLGSVMMRPFFNWLDERHLPCYLETHKEKNVDLYTHYGFSVKGIDTLPDKSQKQYAMLRL